MSDTRADGWNHCIWFCIFVGGLSIVPNIDQRIEPMLVYILATITTLIHLHYGYGVVSQIECDPPLLLNNSLYNLSLLLHFELFLILANLFSLNEFFFLFCSCSVAGSRDVWSLQNSLLQSKTKNIRQTAAWQTELTSMWD